MKRLLVGAATGVGLAVQAQAADLPRRAAPPPAYVPPAFTWTGFYIGLNAGYGFETSREGRDGLGSTLTATPGNIGRFFELSPGGAVEFGDAPFETAGALPAVIRPFRNPLADGGRRSGFVGGGQIGYNWQLTPGAGLVLGFEADAQFAALNRPGSTNFGAFGNTLPNGTVVGTATGPAAVVVAGDGGSATFFDPFGFRSRPGLDWFGTVRGRLGYAFDRALVYATGGLAYGAGRRTDGFTGLGFGTGLGGFGLGCGALGADCGSNRLRIGWTAGGGLEYAFTNHLSVKLEGLYVRLDERGGNNGVLPGDTPVPFARDAVGNTYLAPASAFSNPGFFNRHRDTEFVVVRVGLNYRFDIFGAAPAPAPVVARY